MSSIDFACKRFELDKIIKCSLGLKKCEFFLFDFFMKNSKNYYSTAQLAEILKCDVSSAQRGVKKLYEKDILSRKQMNLSLGGYNYFYQIKEKEEIKKKISGIIEDWANNAKLKIKNL
jgi:predicted transcriptional regulator